MTTSEFRLVICLGAQKAGTSSLYAWLGSLDEVSTSRHGKEIDYFSRHFDAGHDWYLDHFDPEKSTWLDVSPNYAIVRDLRERMDSLPVSYRCVLIARNPVERALSQHRHELAVHPSVTPTSFGDALARNPTYVSGGLYGRMLEGLAPLLEQDRLEVVWFDDLVHQPEKTIDALCRHLGLAARPDVGLLSVPVNVSGRARIGSLHAARRQTGRLVRRLGGEQAVARVRRNPAMQGLLAANTVSIGGIDQPGADALETLRAVFQPDLARAEQISGLPFVDRLGGQPNG